MANPLDRIISEWQAKLADAKRNVEDIERELAALVEARDVIANARATMANATPAPHDIMRRVQTGDGGDGANLTPSQRRARSLSPEWQQVLGKIAETSDMGADINQISGFCKVAGL